MKTINSKLFEYALKLHQNRMLKQAIKVYEETPEYQQGSSFDGLYYPGLAYSQARQFALARKLLSDAVLLDPRHKYAATAHLILGDIDLAEARYDSAIYHYKAAVRLNPNIDAARNKLGNVFTILQRHTEAIDCYNETLIRNAYDYRALSDRGNSYCQVGQYRKAIESCDKALAINPRYIPALNTKGICLLKLEHYEDAARTFRKSIELQPNDTDAYVNLGFTLIEIDNLEDAELSFRAALSINLNLVDAYLGLARIFEMQGCYLDALIYIENALNVEPTHIEGLVAKATIYSEIGRHHDALKLYDQILSINPQSTTALKNRGKLLQEIGRFSDAERSYDSLLQIMPDELSSLISLAILAVEQKQDNENYSKILIEKGNVISDNHQDAVPLHFALGKIFDFKEDYDRSFYHYEKANKLKRRLIQYDSVEHDMFIEKIIETFSRKLLSQKIGSGSNSACPIFIVGMPRSGTTLTEAILSKHPAIWGAGETPHLENALNKLGKNFKRDFTHLVNDASNEKLTDIGNKYLSALRQYSTDKPFIIDKLPINYLWVGAIHLILPNSKIIHLSRNPIDVCLSNYQQYFAGQLNYSYDLKELGDYYCAYDRLMHHWNSILPRGRILNIGYEDLIDHSNTTITKILNYCGLDWHDDCVNFSDIDRRISTASINQVRKGLYRTSIEKWRRYEKYLGPLITALNQSS